MLLNKDHFQAAGFTAIVGAIMSLIVVIGKTIILIRMNNQQCTPEVPMWEYFGMTYQLMRIVVFAIAGYLIFVVSEFLETIGEKLPVFDFSFPKIPDWTLKIILGVCITILGSLALLAIGMLIYGVFIKNPC